MSHVNEEQLILYYYDEAADCAAVETHLDRCPECRAAYASVTRLLNLVEGVPVPERGADYGAQVWGRLAPRLNARPKFTIPVPHWRSAAVGTAVAAVLLAAFFLASGYSERRPVPAVPARVAADPQLEERILKVAVGDYLDRSGVVLLELANAGTSEALDISPEQERAANLLMENRLYYQTALRTGNTVVASVLEDLERVLLEITHAPPRLERAQIEAWSNRLRAEGVLFRMRVLGSTVQREEEQKL
ncbi:MAG: hypothetical protein JO323_25030 [Acidobacteriia bacterium]|nr:hypothetical protein [Terriglobia bacterium]